uniref:DUF5688 family protein n=1 Tax=Lachnoclostridium phocaeense TaxID=1871021 RepID=UPI0026DC5150|nr:DUF5688 family protein [Lachnoclostridium phocaeense]
MTNFENYVLDHFLEYLPEKYKDAKLRIETVTKQNDQEYRMLVLKLTRAKEIRMDLKIAERRAKTDPYDEIISEMAEFFLNNCHNKNGMEAFVSNIIDYTFVKPKLRLIVMSANRNKKLGQQAVTWSFGPVMVQACVYIASGDGNNEGVVRIKPEHLKLWKVTEEQLFEDARLAEEDLFTIHSDADLFTSLTQLGRQSKPNLPATAFYCINKWNEPFGASILAHPDLLYQYGLMLGMKDLVIIPSSLHEILIVTEEMLEGYDLSDIKQMVKEVNEEEVAETDVFDDTLLGFDMNKKKLCSYEEYM